MYKSPDEYLPIIWPIDSGKYLSIKDFNSGTVLFFINVIILRKISIIAKAYTKDENFEMHHMSFLVWNSEMKEPVKVDKYASSLDILPTVLNLFGIDYDSRLLMGTDIMSDSLPLVIYSNRSFITDKGKYNSVTNTFIPFVNNVDNNYVEKTNEIVNNKFIISKLILERDYYRKIYKIKATSK